MRKMRIQLLAYALLSAYILSAQLSESNRLDKQRFFGERFGFSLRVPPGWEVASFSDSGMPIYVYGKISNLKGKDLLPAKLGVIRFAALEDSASKRHQRFSLDQWADFDLLGVTQVLTAKRELSIGQGNGIERAIEISFDEESLDQKRGKRHLKTIYFQFKTHRIAAYLECDKGDPLLRDYERGLSEIIQSISIRQLE